MSEPYWVPISGAPAYYGATPPASPQDGDTWILPADAANGVVWVFRYNAASASAYKWEFVGGGDLFVRIDAGESTTTVGTWLDLGTVSPLVSIPRAGDYDAWAGVNFYASVVCASSFDVVKGATAGTLGPGDIFAPASVQGEMGTISRRITGLTASDDVRVRYYLYAAATATWRGRWLRVRPVRVS